MNAQGRKERCRCPIPDARSSGRGKFAKQRLVIDSKMAWMPHSPVGCDIGNWPVATVCVKKNRSAATMLFIVGTGTPASCCSIWNRRRSFAIAVCGDRPSCGLAPLSSYQTIITEPLVDHGMK